MAVSRINEAGLNVNQYGNRNVMINGAMNVAQRGTSATGLGGNADSYHTIDRFKLGVEGTTAGRLTMTQDSSAPSGFANCLKLACTTADTSIGAAELMALSQIIEGQDLQRFAKGTSDAKPFTVSFYVKGNASATYVCELFDGDNSRHVCKTFSVTTDWTRVELKFPADTTGAFGDDNGASLYLQIFLHAGSNFTSGTLPATWASKTNANRAVGCGSLFDSTSRTFFITGVQLEVGDTATDFEHRSFGDELQRCLRYFYLLTSAGANGSYFRYCNGFMYDATSCEARLSLPVEMRAVPTLTKTGTIAVYDGANVLNAGSFVLGTDGSSKQSINLNPASIAAGGVVHRPCAILSSGNTTSKLEFNAEL